MKKFAGLVESLDQSKSDDSKIKFLADYFFETTDSDKLWAIYLLSGIKLKRQISSLKMKNWALEFAGLSEWIFDESHKIVGDSSETVTLILPPPASSAEHSLTYWLEFISRFEDRNDKERKQFLFDAWNTLQPLQRFVFNKLISGGFRSPVSIKELVKSLSEKVQLDESFLAVKLSENWSPTNLTFEKFFEAKETSVSISKPFPFNQRELFNGGISDLGDPQNWFSEWNYGGIRSQLIYRKNKIFLWSEKGDLLTKNIQEFEHLKTFDSKEFVIEGELLFLENEQLIPIRSGKNSSANKSGIQSLLMASDILEMDGIDLTEKSFSDRRLILKKLIQQLNFPDLIQISQKIDFKNWNDLNLKRTEARDHFAEYVILKSLEKPEKQLKWKPELLSIDAVLIYAQKDESKPSNFFNLYSFGVWNSAGILVPIAKTGSGLTDSEMKEIDFFIRNNVIEKFGPVRTVKPDLVFEIGFEGISKSNRHKSGVSLHSPKILNRLINRRPEDASTLEQLKQFLK